MHSFELARSSLAAAARVDRRRILHLAGTAVAAAAIGALVPALRRQLTAVRSADADLRAPMLYLPLAVTNRCTARVMRIRRSSGLHLGVRTERQTIAAAEGRAPVDVVLYRPRMRAKPSSALLWMHGGGYVGGDLSHDDAWCSRVAAELGIVVISVDYRLAPEHPYPAAIDDSFTALTWLHRTARSLGIDPQRIAVGGASAGGGLAAALAQRASDATVPVRFQLLIYPMLDDRTVARAQRAGTWALLWNPRSNRYGWTSYLGAPGRQHLPYAVPARRERLSGLAPAWIGVGDIDLFHVEDVAYARRLEGAAVPVELHLQAGMYHVADSIRPEAPASRAFRDRAVQALRAGLADAGLEHLAK